METTPHRADILQNILSSAQPNERVNLQKQIAQMTPFDFDRMYSASGGDIREIVAGLSLAHWVDEISTQIQHFDILQSKGRTLVKIQTQLQETQVRAEDKDSALHDLLTL